MLTTILVAVLFLSGGGLTILGLLAAAFAASVWDRQVSRTQTYIARAAISSGLTLLGIAVVWGVAAQVF